jgi:hypothetical protein
MTTSPKSEQTPGAPPLWPCLLVCAVAALCVDLGAIHRLHTADSLLYPLISLWRWTPYYWGQDRVGMLVPALARPITHPLANLLFQDYVNILGGLSAFVLLARYVARSAAYPAVGMSAAALFVAFAPGPYQAMYFIDAAYGVWLSLGLGGLILAEKRDGRLSAIRIAFGFLLILLAHWVNYAAALIFGPVVILRRLIVAPSETARGEPTDKRRWRRPWRLVDAETALAVGLLAVGAVAGRLLTHFSESPVATPLDSLPASEWPDAWLGLIETQWQALRPGRLPAAVAILLALGVATLIWRPIRRNRSASRRYAWTLLLSATAIWLFTGTRLWVRQNGYTYRYLIPATMMIEEAALFIAIGPLWSTAASRVRRALNALPSVALIAGALAAYGLPSIAGVRRDLDRLFGDLTPDLIEARCTHLAGGYERVWPAVFHAAIVLHERGENRVVWGLTGRLEATGDLLGRVSFSDVRIATAIGDRGAEVRRGQLPPMTEVERRRTIRVYVPRQSGPPAAGSDRAP